MSYAVASTDEDLDATGALFSFRAIAHRNTE